MKQLRQPLFFAIAFFVASLGVFNSCERGVSEGVFGKPDSIPYPVFDTFNFPTADYYFFGKFDGHFKKWQDGRRSKWDTITRKNINNPDFPNWPSWPKYEENIYRNIPEQLSEDPCINDSMNLWYEHATRFIRPEIPDERIEIFFYDCVVPDLQDTIEEEPGFHPEIVTWTDFLNGEIAQPFSNTNYGRRGARLVYTDADRTRWETREGSGQLNDTYLHITNLVKRNIGTDTLDTLGMYIIEGEFAGRLYNGSQNIPITEAQFRARLVPRIQQ